MQVDLEFTMAGGISTLEGGFQIAWVKEASEDFPIVCLLCDRNGNAFAKFYKDKTVQHASDLSRAEHEAIQGMKALVLKWEPA